MSLDDSHLDEIEYLLTQSLNGVHHLFDHTTIAKILSRPNDEFDPFSFENLQMVQSLFAELLSQESLPAKRRFLHQLDEASYEVLVRTYFHVVDNSLLASKPEQH